MSRLGRAREQLKQHIVADEEFSGARAERIVRLAMDWFAEYKEWEKTDRFLAAVNDKRMCLSQRGLATVIGDGNPAYLGVKNQDDQGRGSQKVLYPTLTYRTGVDSLKQRLNPTNFGTTAGPITRVKYKLGLHDLSASLMDPATPTISGQARWDLTGSKKDWPLVFMPLPKLKDLVVFNLLNELHKAWRSASHDDLAVTLAHIRRRMTRVKLAQDSDMGAGLINIKPDASGDPNRAKFRYGLADVQSVERNGTWVPIYKAGVSQVRQSKALEYQSILATQQGSSNEIVVAFREHRSPRFPMIGVWNGQGCTLEGSPNPYIKGGIIPDEWATAIELD